MRIRHAVGLAAFCLLAGSRWLVDAVWPPMPSSLLAQALVYALAEAAALVFQVVRYRTRPILPPSSLRIAAAGAVLLGAPSLLGRLFSEVRPETSVALYALAPLCVVFAVVQTSDDGSRGLLMPTLVGFAGALLLLPWRPPSTAAGTIAFAAILLGVALTAGASVWLHTLLRGTRLLQAATLVTLSSALVFGLLSLRAERQSVAVGVIRGAVPALCELLELLLLIWLVRELPPERFASRFFLVPAITVLEGLVLLRGKLDARMGLGLLLLIFGAASLLRMPRRPTEGLGIS